MTLTEPIEDHTRVRRGQPAYRELWKTDRGR